LVGEGCYGLAYIADTTYPPYWWTQIFVGLSLLAVVSALRLRRPRLIALAAGFSMVVAAAFVVVAHQDLISLLS
jgi:hypothetical protein